MCMRAPPRPPRVSVFSPKGLHLLRVLLSTSEERSQEKPREAEERSQESKKSNKRPWDARGRQKAGRHTLQRRRC